MPVARNKSPDFHEKGCRQRQGQPIVQLEDDRDDELTPLRYRDLASSVVLNAYFRDEEWNPEAPIGIFKVKRRVDAVDPMGGEKGLIPERLNTDFSGRAEAGRAIASSSGAWWGDRGRKKKVFWSCVGLRENMIGGFPSLCFIDAKSLPLGLKNYY